jgi:hypothetical protein
MSHGPVVQIGVPKQRGSGLGAPPGLRANPEQSSGRGARTGLAGAQAAEWLQSQGRAPWAGKAE